MFEDNIEKGLFTFYREQDKNQKKDSQQKLFSLPNSPKRINFTQNAKQEEISLAFAEPLQQTKTLAIQMGLSKIHCASSHDKQNRQFLLPNTIDISSKLSKQLGLKQSNPTQIKHSQIKQKHSSFCKLPLIKKALSQQLSLLQVLQHNSQCLQKIVFKDQAYPAKQSGFKAQKKTVKPIIQRSHYVNNTKKIDTQRLGTKKQMNSNLHFYDKTQKSKKTQKQPAILSPRDLTNKRAQKDSFLLQKLMIERMQEGSRCSSVISIGVSSCDEYMQRWQKRKQQFLSLLARNMPSEALRR